MRPWLGSAALLIATLVLCAGAGEIGLRLAGATRGERERERLDVYRPSSTLTYELRPSWRARFAFNDFDVIVNTNALGFRGPEVARAKRPGVRRILVVGDSFAFGWGVEDDETFSSVLDAELRAAGVAAEVLDAGVPGYATDHYLIFLRERGFDLDPDLILIAICGNDPEELAWTALRLGADRLPVASISKRRFVNQRGEMRFLNDGFLDLPASPLPEVVSDWLYEHSLAYQWLRIRFTKAWITHVGKLAQARSALAPGDVPSAPIETLSAADISRALSGSAEFRLRYHRRILAAIESEAAARGIPIRFVLIEGAEQALRSDCAVARCLDQADLFQRERDPDTYLAVDGHWSPRGHRRLGEALASWLLADAELALR